MFFLTDGSKSVVAEVQLDEAGVGGHNAASQVGGVSAVSVHSPDRLSLKFRCELMKFIQIQKYKI